MLFSSCALAFLNYKHYVIERLLSCMTVQSLEQQLECQLVTLKKPRGPVLAVYQKHCAIDCRGERGITAAFLIFYTTIEIDNIHSL